MISRFAILIAAAPMQSFAVVIGENRPLDDTTTVLSFADDDADSHRGRPHNRGRGEPKY